MTLLLTLDDGSVQRKLADAVEFARAAVLEDAPEEQIGAHVGVSREDAVTASHLFEAQVPGYRGWRWSVTVALAGDDEPVTTSEVVLVPGPSALIAPAWVPWERRVRAGDLGVGDIFPTDDNDPRLAPAYLQSDDPAVEEVSHEAGLGRVHVLSRFGRTDAATRWHSGEFGPRSDMARSAPDVCGTCGFFVPLAGSLRGVFGVCSNDISPADGHVVDVEYGCGAHSEVEVEVTSSVPVAELVYDDSLLDFEPVAEGAEPESAAAAGEPEAAVAEPAESAAEAEAAPEAVEAKTAAPEAKTAEAEPEAAAAETVEPEAAAEPESAAAEPETGIAEADLAPAEVEPEVAAEPADAESPAAGVVAEPVEADVVAEPDAAAGVAEVPVPGHAEPVAAEAPTQTEPESEAVAEHAAVGEPAAAEQTTTTSEQAASAEVAGSVDAVQSEETAPEGQPAPVEVVAESDAQQGGRGAEAEAEVPVVALTDEVVTEASAAGAETGTAAPGESEAGEDDERGQRGF
ncbi:hypothetical protein GCM10027258_07620 [Amycolatopsis stemonae]